MDFDLDKLADDLRNLPLLARDARPVPARQLPNLSSSHPAPGSKVPEGLDLDGIDTENDRQHAQHLTRLGQCVRVVLEEFPDLTGAPTRASWWEVSHWLLATMPTWCGDEWVVEWITTEVDAITSALRRTIDAQVDRTACPSCGVRLDAHTTDALMVATCPDCERVVAMRTRVSKRRWEELQRERLAARARHFLTTIGVIRS